MKVNIVRRQLLPTLLQVSEGREEERREKSQQRGAQAASQLTATVPANLMYLAFITFASPARSYRQRAGNYKLRKFKIVFIFLLLSRSVYIYICVCVCVCLCDCDLACCWSACILLLFMTNVRIFTHCQWHLLCLSCSALIKSKCCGHLFKIFCTSNNKTAATTTAAKTTSRNSKRTSEKSKYFASCWESN